MRTKRDRWLVAGSIWGPALFVFGWVLGSLLFVGYSPLKETISELAAVDASTRVVMTVGLPAFGVGVGTSAWHSVGSSVTLRC